MEFSDMVLKWFKISNLNMEKHGERFSMNEVRSVNYLIRMRSSLSWLFSKALAREIQSNKRILQYKVMHDNKNQCDTVIFEAIGD